ncbi:hypothetical protein IQ266_19930 [filamentous cyanobacterium LEGE 11480]|uniref:Uncharacterized protein n=1 Tax=Romeriopsis navalis LEGE 11480 TaxID=2777977 RepID=A0A928Z3Z2_9CYAN|nr:hypothetical protein [Romeriopsis navalis]MBE9032011.1 hypothetical protein [Romeriopsis navalis LEGE 11480]
MSITEIWQRKSDTELQQAATELQDYRPDVRTVIAAELVRRGIVDPGSVQELQLPPPSRDLLLAAYQVTEADLAINRTGRLTPAQQSRLQVMARSDARWVSGLAGFFAIPMYGLLYVLWQSGRVFDFRNGVGFSQVVLLGVTAVLPTLVLLYGIQTFRIYRRSRQLQVVKTIEGEVELQQDHIKGGVVLYWLVIGKWRFPITPQVNALLRNGHLCCVYYEPITQAIAAIEPIERSPLV